MYRRFADPVRVPANSFSNPEAAANLTDWTGISLTRIASDSDFGTSCASLPVASGNGTITFGPAGRFGCVENQITFARCEFKITGPGAVALWLVYYDEFGSYLHGPAYIASHPAPVAGEVYDLEGFYPAPVGAASVEVALQLFGGSSSTLRTTRVQIIANARDDVPAYVNTAQVIEVPAYSPFGFNDVAVHGQLLDPEDHIRLLGELGADWTRCGPISYSAFSGIPADWQATDIAPYMNAFAAAGIRLCHIAGIPHYLNGGGGDTSIDSLSPTDYDDLAAFHVSFIEEWPDVVKAVEWSNEPNIGFFYGAGGPSGAATVPDAAKYWEILDTLYPAIKGVADIPVIGGALACKSSDAGGANAWVSMENFMADIGSAPMDALSFHPYPNGIGTATGTDLGVDEACWIARDAGLPLWITETGIPNSIDEEPQAIGIKLLRGWCQRQDDVDGVFLHTQGGDADWALMNLTNGYRRQAVSQITPR